MKCFPIAVPTSYTLYAVSFVDAEIVIAAGASGAILLILKIGAEKELAIPGRTRRRCEAHVPERIR